MDLRRQLMRLLYIAGIGPVTRIAPWQALEDAGPLRALLQGQRYYALGRALDRLRERAPAEWYGLALEALADWPGATLTLDWWVAEASHRAEPWLARGIHGMNQAEGMVGIQPGPGGVAALHRYFRRIEQSERDLAEGAQRDPGGPEPYAWLLATALASGAEADEIQARFAAVRARAPDHLRAHLLLLQSLGDDGDARAALAFARSTGDAAPRGDPLHALIPCAYIEHWAWTRYLHGPETADAQLRVPGIFGELTAAYYRSGLGQEPGPQDPPILHRFAAGCFAAAFYLAGERTAARESLSKVGPWASPYPWRYLQTHVRDHLDPGYVVDRLRNELHQGLSA